METVTIPPDMPDLVTEMSGAIGISCEQVNRQTVVPAGQGAAAQAWLDNPARLVEAVARYRSRLRRAVILYAATRWREEMDEPGERIVADFAAAIGAWAGAHTALGGALNPVQSTLVTWAQNEISGIGPLAKKAYDVIQRAQGTTDLDVLYRVGSNPALAQEFGGPL